MQMKTLFVFLMAVSIVLPLATAINCTALDGENKKVCRYIEKQPWSKSEKDSLIQELIDNGGSLNGDFNSIMGNPIPEIQLNKPEKVDMISEDNKKFLIDISSGNFKEVLELGLFNPETCFG